MSATTPGTATATGTASAVERSTEAGSVIAPRLVADEVGVDYGSTTVVDRVSFSVDAGRWLVVIGPNGAGKSSLLKALAGVVPHRGRVSLDGDRAPSRAVRARRVAFVPQQPVLPPGMTCAEYVLLGRTAHLGWFANESPADRARVVDVLDRLSLGQLAGRPITELSGGESQRATLARALVQGADVLVLDEPTSALDLAHQIAVLELIDQIRVSDRLAVVTAMHDLGVASRFADSLLLLAAGVPVASGPAREVLTEESLSRHYGTPVSVMDGPDGGLVVIPLRGAPSSSPHRTPSTHD